MSDTLYCSVTNSNTIYSAVVTGNHDSPVTTATVECGSTSLTLGDPITIDMGYTDNHQVLFTGYVKQIDRKVPNNTYQITAYDTLVRAQDFFIASADPNAPFSRQNISAEDLVGDLLALAGLTDYDPQTTFFTFGIRNPFEINLVAVYDYVKTICDTITWAIWADSTGTINFKNRKPYVMLGTSGQPGDVADVPTGFVLYIYNSLSLQYSKSEKSLRNRVVVYGSEGIHAEAQEASSVLPVGFYKSAVLAMPQLIDSQTLAQSIADYNLDLLNRTVETINVTTIGDPTLAARTVIEVNIPLLDLSGNWYVFGCDHSLNSGGYTVDMNLRRMVKE